jgi:hypothetical protein
VRSKSSAVTPWLRCREIFKATASSSKTFDQKRSAQKASESEVI